MDSIPEEVTRYYHGTTSYMKPGEIIEIGHPANFRIGIARTPENYVWLCDEECTAEQWAIFAAERYGGQVHVYEVQPTGPIMPDRGIATGQVLPGNFQSSYPLTVIREI